MTQEEREKLTEALAEQLYIIRAADNMITVDVAKLRWAQHKQQRTQLYLSGLHHITDALEAIKALGYRLEKTEKKANG